MRTLEDIKKDADIVCREVGAEQYNIRTTHLKIDSLYKKLDELNKEYVGVDKVNKEAQRIASEASPVEKKEEPST